MRWTNSEKIVSERKTVLYSGHGEQHQRGVGLILGKEAARALLGWKPVSERIITTRLQSRHSKTTIIQVYAPIEDTEDTEKDAF